MTNDAPLLTILWHKGIWDRSMIRIPDTKACPGLPVHQRICREEGKNIVTPGTWPCGYYYADTGNL